MAKKTPKRKWKRWARLLVGFGAFRHQREFGEELVEQMLEVVARWGLLEQRA